MFRLVTDFATCYISHLHASEEASCALRMHLPLPPLKSQLAWRGILPLPNTHLLHPHLATPPIPPIPPGSTAVVLAVLHAPPRGFPHPMLPHTCMPNFSFCYSQDMLPRELMHEKGGKESTTFC